MSEELGDIDDHQIRRLVWHAGLFEKKIHVKGSVMTPSELMNLQQVVQSRTVPNYVEAVFQLYNKLFVFALAGNLSL